MRGETVPQRMGRYMLLDAGLRGCLSHSRPNDLLRDGHISPPIVHHAWEQVCLGLHPAPVLSQSLQTVGGQQNIAIAAALALMDMNDHAFAVDVGHLQVTQLGSSQPRCIQRHQHRAMHQVPSRIYQPRDLLRTEYSRQLPGPLGERNLIEKVGAPKSLDEEKPQSRTSTLDSAWRQLPIAKQVHLVLANMAWTKALWRAVEVLRKVLHRVDVATDCAWRVVATLEFIQHQLPKMGHGKPPVTRGLHSQQSPGKGHAAASVAPAT